MTTLLARLTVLAAGDDAVVCTGSFASANSAGMQSLVNPNLLLTEITRVPALDAAQQPTGEMVPVVEGDVIEKYDDGSYAHLPVRKA